MANGNTFECIDPDSFAYGEQVTLVGSYTQNPGDKKWERTICECLLDRQFVTFRKEQLRRAVPA